MRAGLGTCVLSGFSSEVDIESKGARRRDTEPEAGLEKAGGWGTTSVVESREDSMAVAREWRVS